ncbi:hypothetical protein LEMLEM_LOCUS21206 [Lemmus lemmus]
MVNSLVAMLSVGLMLCSLAILEKCFQSSIPPCSLKPDELLMSVMLQPVNHHRIPTAAFSFFASLKIHVESSPGPDEHEDRKCEGWPCALPVLCSVQGAEAPGYFICMLIHGGLKSAWLGTAL